MTARPICPRQHVFNDVKAALSQQRQRFIQELIPPRHRISKNEVKRSSSLLLQKQPGIRRYQAHGMQGFANHRFTPPGPVFGIAWTFLDGLLGYAGYRLLLAKPSNARSTALSFGLNLLGISGFSWVLFGRKRLDEATAVSLAVIGTSAAAASAATGVDKRAWAIAPLIGWVIFASVLQEEVWRRND